MTLQPATPDADRSRLVALELEIAVRERELLSVKDELQRLQRRYLQEVGPHYAQLAELDAKIAAREIAAGLRPAVDDDPAGDDDDGAGARELEMVSSCSNRGAPTDDLKKMFRQLAKSLHPDLALNDPARWRRHSLMAEANRAYAERDEDRLRLIMNTWERMPDATLDDDPDAARGRLLRRLSNADARMIAIDLEFADLRRSAIWRLKTKIDDARAQGWDLFAEMILSVKREVQRANWRLASL
ncbi:MAG TPA: J domain-containing protein [Vicinamibacterales bacterium]|nr:J domain-containing protein [Vicinamibacterales bacterium]